MQAARAKESRKQRYHALTVQAFADSVHQSSKWRMAMIVPFHLGVLALLYFRGAPPVRCWVQFGVIVWSLAMLAVKVKHESAPRVMTSMGLVGYFVTLCNTGGLASPLLITCIPLILGMVLNPAFEGWRKLYFKFLLAGFLLTAFLSHTCMGTLTAPLAPMGGWSSREYVGLSLAAVIFTVGVVKKMSSHLAKVYERVALELADHREELYCESEDRTRSMESIAARLAHEVKNPLAAIRGMSAHVCGSVQDEKLRERLGIVKNEAERLQQIVEGFLSFSRGLEDLKIEEVRPHEVAKEITTLLEMSAAEAGVSLEVKGNPDLTIAADRRKLRQALLNFVLNAIQASKSGSTVRVEIGKSADGAAHIEIQDHGAGMGPDVLERIKRPYFSTKKSGAGLGVAIARGLIEQHGGMVRFESSPGKGTKVHCDLPPSAMAAARAQRLPNPAHDPAPQDLVKAEPVVQTAAKA
jgi:signal transduction histidine kinase